METASMKYIIKARFITDGVVDKPDVVGAIFGQTEGLLGENLDIRDLQKSGRIGRIEVELETKMGKSEGKIHIPSSLDLVETALVAAALETVGRIGPCRAKIFVEEIEDIRINKRQKIIERARELLENLLRQSKEVSDNMVKTLLENIRTDEVMSYGEEKLPAGPAIDSSEEIIVVEGRNDVLNLLRHGIRNVIAMNGTSVPKTIIELSKKKTITAFIDGDHAGDLIIKELLQVADVDYIARAPPGTEVEELTSKQIMKALRDKIPAEDYKELISEKSEKVVEKEAEIKEVRESKETSRESFYRDLVEKSFETRVAYLLDANNNVLEEIPMSQLIEKLEILENKNISKLVFGGIISQRLVDICFSKEILEIHGIKKGNITKKPINMKIIAYE